MDRGRWRIDSDIKIFSVFSGCVGGRISRCDRLCPFGDPGRSCRATTGDGFLGETSYYFVQHCSDRESGSCHIGQWVFLRIYIIVRINAIISPIIYHSVQWLDRRFLYIIFFLYSHINIWYMCVCVCIYIYIYNVFKALVIIFNKQNVSRFYFWNYIYKNMHLHRYPQSKDVSYAHIIPLIN